MKFTIRTLLLLVLIAAIAIMHYTRPPTQLEEVKGVRVLSRNENGDLGFLFESTVRRRSVAHVVRLVPIGGRIDFYDGRHPTISDPGAYGTLCRGSDREFFVYFGNHGWSTQWFPLSYEEAIEYFWICHTDNLVEKTDWPHGKMTFDISPLRTPKAERINRDPTYRPAVHVRELIRKYQDKDVKDDLK